VADGKLVFRRAASGSGKLVFGNQSGNAAPIPDAHISADAAVRHARGEGACDAIWRTVAGLSLDAAVHDEGAGWADADLLWQHNVTRGGMRAPLDSHWQEGAAVASATSNHWQQSARQSGAVGSHWQSGQAVAAVVVNHWQESVRLRAGIGNHWQQGARVAAAMRSDWQEARPLRAVSASHWQQGARVAAALGSHWQEMLRRRVLLDSHWQSGLSRVVALLDDWTDAQRLHSLLDVHWQEAMRPPAGVSKQPVIAPPPLPVCMDPQRLGRLVFEQPATGGWKLVFVCRKPRKFGPPAKVLVPVRSVYMTVNDAVLINLATGNHIPCLSMRVALDVDSWTWQFSASVPGRALPDVLPNHQGDLPLVQATINGVALRFVVEKVARERSFASSQLNINGRGLAAQLDAPYAAEMTFANVHQRSARQLLDDIFTFNGVSIGWDFDWDTKNASKPADWSVPAKVFNHTGTYISAANAIVGAVGAYIQPDDTQQILHVLARYPRPAWQWAGVVPDVELPAAVVTTEGIEWLEKPDYNRVWVSGQEGGIVGRYTRQGTAGDRLAPTVVDALITHYDAARQRGRMILSDTGRLCMLSLRLPVLEDVKIIRPGQFVRYDEMLPVTGTDIGMVRSVSVEVAHPTTYQTITLETHPNP